MVSKALADETVQLFVKSDNSALSDKGLNAPHEGAGINYFFANTGNGASLDLNYDGSSLTVPLTVNGDETVNQYFSVADGIASLAPEDKVTGFTFAEDGTLEYNGSADGFEACKNVNDPYQYSTTSYAIVYGSSSGSDCVPIKLYKKGGSSSSSASSSEAASTTSHKSDTKTSSQVSSSSSTVSSYVVTVSGGVKTFYTTLPCPEQTTPAPAPAPVTPQYSNSTTPAETPAGPTTITFGTTSTVITSCSTDSNGQVITKTITEPCPLSTTTSTPAASPEKPTPEPSKAEETTSTPASTPETTAPQPSKAEETSSTTPKEETSSATTIATVSTGTASTQPSITLAEGAAADFKPQGAFALAAAFAAALLM
ncbi:unnamed protein product [Ambrosiozyma monospora]|uniref:Unnamed protein product n=1 Tax=Ambrosiozyma monospora TaxID=43982 RepID=A0ACB5T6G1_AMBMO|nr:unnamed protein product [Ambrosiozyma monospora]